MKKTALGILSILFVFSLISSGMGKTAEAADKPVNLKFASMSVGGSWYIYAANIAELAKAALPANSRIDVLPYQGGVGNPILVNKGEADIGLSFSAIGNWAYQGIVDYAGKGKMTDIRSLVGGLNKPHRLTIMVVKKNLNINSVQEIKDKKLKVKLITAQKGAAGEALARQVLESYGMSYTDLTSWGGSVNHIELGVAIQQMKDGQADMFIHNVGYKQPDIAEMFLSGNIKFVALGPSQSKFLADKYGFEEGLAIDKGEFEGVDQPVPSLGYPTGVIANKNLSAETAYVITKVICENKQKLTNAHSSLAAFDPTQAWKPSKNGNIPLHPGAEKYYREKGWMK